MITAKDIVWKKEKPYNSSILPYLKAKQAEAEKEKPMEKKEAEKDAE